MCIRDRSRVVLHPSEFGRTHPGSGQPETDSVRKRDSSSAETVPANLSRFRQERSDPWLPQRQAGIWPWLPLHLADRNDFRAGGGRTSLPAGPTGVTRDPEHSKEGSNRGRELQNHRLPLDKEPRDRFVGVARRNQPTSATTVSYTHLRAHETRHDLVCRLLLE